VNASLLAQGGGKYHCGKCKKPGSALDSLFDEWPGAGDRPPGAGDIPVLESSIDLNKARQSSLAPDESGLFDDSKNFSIAPTRPGNRLTRPAWITLLFVVAVTVTFKLSEFYQLSLINLPIVQSAKARLGMQNPHAAQPFRDLAQIHLASRELSSHPFRADMLRLTATIVNRAPEIQPYPDLEVTLLDANGRPVSQFRFSPSDYLTEGASRDSGMTSQAYLPLVLDLPDPGTVARGFELNFL
jgi:hypothetical protein